jgi:hypothetical protein
VVNLFYGGEVVYTTTYPRLGDGCVSLVRVRCNVCQRVLCECVKVVEPTREQRLEALVRVLVREVNVYNQHDCLNGYHNGLGDTWVVEGDSTTVNQELEALELPQLEDVATGEDDES